MFAIQITLLVFQWSNNCFSARESKSWRFVFFLLVILLLFESNTIFLGGTCIYHMKTSLGYGELEVGEERQIGKQFRDSVEMVRIECYYLS